MKLKQTILSAFLMLIFCTFVNAETKVCVQSDLAHAADHDTNPICLKADQIAQDIADRLAKKGFTIVDKDCMRIKDKDWDFTVSFMPHAKSTGTYINNSAVVGNIIMLDFKEVKVQRLRVTVTDHNAKVEYDFQRDTIFECKNAKCAAKKSGKVMK